MPREMLRALGHRDFRTAMKPVRDNAGGHPIVIAKTTDPMSYVFERVAAGGGNVRVGV